MTAGALPPGTCKASGAISAGGRYLRDNAGSLRRLLGREAERFGTGPAVVLGQDLTEVAWPVGHRAVADLAAGDR